MQVSNEEDSVWLEWSVYMEGSLLRQAFSCVRTRANY